MWARLCAARLRPRPSQQPAHRRSQAGSLSAPPPAMFNFLRPAALATRQLARPQLTPLRFAPSLRLSSSESLPTAPISPSTADAATTPAKPSATPLRPQKHKKNKTKAAQAAALASSVPRPPAQAASSTAPFAPTSEPPLATFASLLELGLRGKSDKGGRAADGQAIALTTAESFDTPALLKTLQSLGLLQGDPENGLGPGKQTRIGCQRNLC